MAMTAEEMNAIFLALTNKQAELAEALTNKQAELAEKAALTAINAAQVSMDRQAQINQDMMKDMMKTIREEAALRKADEETSRIAAAATATAAAAATAAADKTAEKKHPSKIYDNKIDPKQFQQGK